MRKKKPDPIVLRNSVADELFLEINMQMLAFFILLVTYAVITPEKHMAALGSLAGTFSEFEHGANVNEGKGPTLPALSIIQEYKKMPKRTAKALTELSKELGGGSEVLPLDKRTVRVWLPDRVLFIPGTANLKPSSKPVVAKMAKLLNKKEVQEIVIEGHSDEPFIANPYSSNFELSAARALEVFKIFSVNGIGRWKMVVEGKGKYHPVYTKDGKIDFLKSKRVEILVRFVPVTDEDQKEMRDVSGGRNFEHVTRATSGAE